VSPGSTAILIAALADIIRLTETSTPWPQASVTSLRACLACPAAGSWQRHRSSERPPVTRVKSEVRSLQLD